MDLEELKRLAGVNEPQPWQNTVSLENISHTANELKQKERELGLKPGDPDWFKLWFSLPYMTGQPSFRGRKK